MDFPKNQKEGQRFLEAVNYYGRLIPNMTALLKPLTTEIGKGKAFTLNDEIGKGVFVDHLKYPSDGDSEFLFVAADTSLTNIFLKKIFISTFLQHIKRSARVLATKLRKVIGKKQHSKEILV
jgi:hypothetical protein